MVNVCVLQGRLTRDVDLRYTTSNVAVANFGIAVDRDFKNADGSRDADFFEIVAWRATGEFAKKYFRKGDAVVITGKAQSRTYDDKDGNRRKVVEFVAESVNFCGSKQSNGDSEQQYKPATAPVNVAYDEPGDDLPF